MTEIPGSAPSVALSGGAVALPEAVVPDAGAVLASGQAVVSSIDVIEALAKATVAYTGQAVGTATDETALPAVQAVAVVGQGVTAVEPVIIGKATVTYIKHSIIVPGVLEPDNNLIRNLVLSGVYDLLSKPNPRVKTIERL